LIDKHRLKTMACSEAALFQGRRGLFEARGFPEKIAASATYFAFATWFPALLPIAPFLLLTGAGPEGCLVLDLLACVVQKPLPLFELTRGGFLSLDVTTQPTLLIRQGRLTESTWSILCASNHPNAQISTTNGIKKIYCTKALYLGDESMAAGTDDGLLRIDIPPSHGRLPVLDANEKLRLSAEFQPQMRAYYERNATQVRDSAFYLPDFSSPLRILSRALGAPLAGAPELQNALGPLLHELQESMNATLWLDPKCVVIEALLFWSHKRETAAAHVGAIAETANAILQGRGENTQLEAKAVGATLRRLGLVPKRDRQGYAIRLDDTVRRQVHRLASQFAVASVQEGMMRCDHCAECFSCESVGDEKNASSLQTG
jgi:hypothetical protein